jgi:CheY-like chemotaxis protein
VVLTVRDTGYGMDPGTLARAFEPFFTTKEIGKGTGLGLSSVYGVVKQSGGDIRIDSQPGAGTTVTILLPRSHAQPAMPTQGAEPATPTGGETILLVEDEEPLRTVIRRVLDRLGYRVREAGSAEMALAVLRAEPELTVDLLLTDVVMPGGSGVDLAAAIRSLRPDLPVVFISGHADEDVVRYGLDRSDVALLTKPFTPDELGVLIQSRLHPRGRPRVSGAPTLP